VQAVASIIVMLCYRDGLQCRFPSPVAAMLQTRDAAGGVEVGLVVRRPGRKPFGGGGALLPVPVSWMGLFTVVCGDRLAAVVEGSGEG